MRSIFRKVYRTIYYISLVILVLSLSGKLVIISDKLATLSVLVLGMILGEKPLYSLMLKFNFDPSLTKLLKYNNQQQRYQGLISLNLAFAHGISEMLKAGLFSPTTISNLVSCAAALIIFGYLLITSSKTIQKYVKHWKKGQIVVWALSPSLILHVLFVKQELGIAALLFIGSIVLVLIEKYVLKQAKWRKHKNYLIIGFILAIIQAYAMYKPI